MGLGAAAMWMQPDPPARIPWMTYGARLEVMRKQLRNNLPDASEQTTNGIINDVIEAPLEGLIGVTGHRCHTA